MPKPEVIEGFAFKCEDKQFESIVNRIGRMRQSGTIDSVVHIANDLRVISSQSWMDEYRNEDGPFSNRQRASFRKMAGISNWNALGGIYGTRRVVNAKKKEIAIALKEFCKVRFFSRTKVKLLNQLTSSLPEWQFFQRARNLSSAISDVFGLLNGVPLASHLEGAFYRHRPSSGKVIDAG